MSYSFSVKGNTKAEAAAAVAAQFDQVVEGQPVHAKDREAVVSAASGLIEILSADEDKEVLVSVSGYVSWSTAIEGNDHPIQTVSTTVTAHLQAKSETAAPGGSDQGGA